MTHTDSFTDNFSRSTLVFVTDQFECERLISQGHALAKVTRTTLTVISIVTPDSATGAIEHLFRVSRTYGASMNVIYSDGDVVGIMSRAILQNRACHVITGVPQGENSVLSRLWRLLPAVNFYTVSLSGRMDAVPIESKCPAQED